MSEKISKKQDVVGGSGGGGGGGDGCQAISIGLGRGRPILLYIHLSISKRAAVVGVYDILTNSQAIFCFLGLTPSTLSIRADCAIT